MFVFFRLQIMAEVGKSCAKELEIRRNRSINNIFTINPWTNQTVTELQPSALQN